MADEEIEEETEEERIRNRRNGWTTKTEAGNKKSWFESFAVISKGDDCDGYEYFDCDKFKKATEHEGVSFFRMHQPWITFVGIVFLLIASVVVGFFCRKRKSYAPRALQLPR